MCMTGARSDATGVPINPVSGGLPMAGDELAAFKLVGAALLMAYIEVRAELSFLNMSPTLQCCNLHWNTSVLGRG